MKRAFLIAGIVIGGLLMLGPFWGLIGTTLGMVHSFRALAAEGATDPQALSNSIGQTLLSSAIGIVVCPIGIILLIVCIVKLTNSPKTSRSQNSPTVLTPPTLPS